MTLHRCVDKNKRTPSSELTTAHLGNDGEVTASVNSLTFVYSCFVCSVVPYELRLHFTVNKKREPPIRCFNLHGSICKTIKLSMKLQLVRKF